MKKKLKANAYYMGSILLGVGVLVCASGIEHSEGWAMFGWPQRWYWAAWPLGWP